MKNVAITGVSGFLGQFLAEKLTSVYSILGVVRKKSNFPYVGCEIDESLTLRRCAWLEGIDVVIHCAARAHIMNESSKDPISDYRKVNTAGTLNLAHFAAISGVKRFIYISSIKVHGERNHGRNVIIEEEQLEPVDPYGISKLEAEIGLRKIAADTGMEVVIIRPPLIYGPGVKANFESMMKWLHKGLPIPLGLVKNKRSLVGIDNLCDFIQLCIEHPEAANEAFLISDQCDVSTSELLQKLKKSLSSKSVIMPVPVPLMNFGAKLIGKGQMAQRLFDDLYVSSEKATRLLGWKPPFSMQEQLDKTALHFIQHAGERT
ncbi:UDP-glucose 4-epimerase family protein [Aliidiomarina haloalkalitolerans]|uniref:NAD-dependent epimerase/dehydratase domain-containing protein n=1 Tax=Aliidiomarina haloalkalitolerans TaxID=859059 RepID=A0A432VQX3_9GAMM|nr:SDR family oxidoreductase [Aliidiomarina haloalkalitolerans]RUO18670.1 hypothetical protein CWE06_10530 [Aliidiomarina haloalkalitolerans]